MLTIVPQGGLCNRLRAVLSALSLSQQLHVEVQVKWVENEECRARFDDLFVPIDSGRFHIGPMTWWAWPSRKRNFHLPRLLRVCMGYTWQRDGYVPSSLTELAEALTHYRKVYVSSGSQLADYSSECLSRLCPRADLQARIDRMLQSYAPHTVGVHIRRTDNAVSIQHSPVEAFIHAMRQEIDQDRHVKFFLATDDAAVKQMLEQQFPHRIITQHTSVKRDTLQGMEDALVDLWCLAGTQKLLGSYWSSFTDTAAEIGHVPLVVVRA